MDWPCTADEIVELRDGRGLSWRNVAIELGLGEGKKARSPFAKRAYKELTGKDPSDSHPVRAQTPAKGEQQLTRASVHWDDSSDQDAIEAALLGDESHRNDGSSLWRPRKLLVLRDLNGKSSHEEIFCRYATGFTFGPEGDQPLQVHIVEHLQTKDWQGTQFRTLFVHKIVKVT